MVTETDGDRPRDPCPDCGEELYDKYWGQGGWVPTEKATNRVHGPSDCVKKLKTIPTKEVLARMAAVKEAVDPMSDEDIMHSITDVLRELLVCCYYIEDLRAIKYFVFHPRLNGDSNVCLLCNFGCVDGIDELWDSGHEKNCPYPAALQRVRGRETLASWRARKQ